MTLRLAAATVITLALTLAAGAQTAPPLSASDAGLAAGLAKAMQANAQRDGRLIESGEGIRPYIATGYVRAKPELRDDYTDYRVVRKPAKLFGQDLLVIEEEYQLKFIGCCGNEGLGAILRVTADLAPLKEFASANGCSLNTDDVVERLRKLRINATGELLAVSCRERDLQQR
jgi:hypothetical protein